jgi:protocatechuate 3,4-dioxygenase, alpha subunit
VRTDVSATPSQTVGPFFHVGLSALPGLRANTLATPNVHGAPVSVRGRVIDGEGNGVPDALLEMWQADAAGSYSERFGFARVPTDADGAFAFTTIKPGRVPGPGGVLQAPHLSVTIFMRGLLRQLRTRIYFAGDPANGDDPILNLVDPSRRDTLIAHPISDTEALQWNVILQGDDETVFFDC